MGKQLALCAGWYQFFFSDTWVALYVERGDDVYNASPLMSIYG
jgi:hypothetical protein